MKLLRSPALLVASLLACTALAVTNDAAAGAVAKNNAIAAAAPGIAAMRKRPLKSKSGKYFHEPGTDNKLGHYDDRYFKGVVPYEEHRPALRHLIRSYLMTFRTIGVETWLAHGTLLGWWWNGKIMPWDYDLDVQVSDITLYYLSKHFNRTVHTYSYRDETTGAEIVKEYLLDINPNHGLPRGDGRNIIDARWIDTANGMFIDITGLAEREPKRNPGIWSCKNFHRYRTRELYPMRETEFEGVPATVPYSFDKILTDEYGTKSLVTTKWEGHEWHPELKEWIKVEKNAGTNFATKMAQKSKSKQDAKKAMTAASRKATSNAESRSGLKI